MTRSLGRCFYNYVRNSSGNLAIMSAMTMPVLLAVAAFGVDEGALYYEKRELQGNTDIAAIVAAANIAKAELAANTALNDNGVLLAGESGKTLGGIKSGEENSGAKVTVEVGTYVADRTVAFDKRFTTGAGTKNAVRVTVAKTGTLYFASAFATPPVITTTAVASASAAAAFSVGSRLASLNGGIVNGLLGGLLGTSVSLSVMDYNALLAARVDVLSFFDALATELGITAGTYNDVLATNASVGQIADALLKVAGDDPAAAAALSAFSGDAKFSNVSVPLDRLIDLGPAGSLSLGQGDAGFDATAAIMDILTASAAVSDGTHQATLNLGTTIPGVASASVDVAIGEPPQHSPWFAIGEAGKVVRTAQTRLRLIAQIGGNGLLSGVTIRLPLYVDLAYAEASLNSISCPTGNPASATVTIDATPGIADAWLAEVNASQLGTFSATPAVSASTIVSTPLIKATALAHARIGNGEATTLTFTHDDIENHVLHSVSTSDFTGNLTKTLIGDLDLTVSVGGLSLATPTAIKSAITTALGAAAPAIDSVIYNVLNAAGVKVGEADIWVNGVQCQRAVLVQ